MAEYDNLDEAPTEPEFDNQGRNRMRLLIFIVAAIIAAVLLVLIARAIYNAVSNNEATLPAPTTQQQQQQQPKTDKNAPQGASGNQGATPEVGTAPGTGSQAQNNQLPNSGPESLAAIFAGSSLTGAGLHYMISRRVRR